MATKNESAAKAAVSREDRLNKLSTKKARHDLKQRQNVRKRKFSFRRRERKRDGKLAVMTAYDFETTKIKQGTPTPLYITAFNYDLNYTLSRALNGLDDVRKVITDEFLQDKFNGVKYVAWNANNFDVYFIAMAMMSDERFVLRPYLTKSKALRGLRIIPKEDLELKPNQQRSWEFLDGISMLGLQGTSLKAFLVNFAPEYQKMDRESFETKDFDANDPEDVEYAMRDSEGLWFGMMRAQEIIFERFNMGLRTTMGNLGIKILETKLPEEIMIREPSIEALDILRQYVVRGGYCHLMRPYKGPIWKYDLNQAYAAAMRETELPAGDCQRLKGESKYSVCYMARVTATNPKNTIPFYCREMVDGRLRSVFATTKINDSWLCSTEVKQLRAEGWKVTVSESYVWYKNFNMKDYVDSLEHMRQNAPGGPKGAPGTMVKQIGNNSYGKTLEELEPLELVLAAECPPGFADYYGQENPDMVPYVWCRLIDTPHKNYHQPQIGGFITAHVRMVIRRSAMLAPAEFIYADTDCVCFSKDVTAQLDIDSSRYGAFKLEEQGAEFMFIAKKVYASLDFKTKHSKGLAVKELTLDDFIGWSNGIVPEQSQVQRQNFVKVMRGSDMFVNRKRKGTAV